MHKDNPILDDPARKGTTGHARGTRSEARAEDPIELALPPAERRWLKWLKRAGWTLAGVYFALALGMVALRYFVIPRVGDYKAEIAQAVTRAVGERVEIGALEAEWFGLHPRLELADVRVIDREGNEALALPYVGVTVAWRSILYGELRFRSIVFDRPELRVRRDTAGRFYVAGLPVRPDERPEPGAAGWLLRQGEIHIRDASVEWEDGLRNAPPLALKRLDFVLRNDGRHHRFALRAEPPREFASAIDIRGELLGRSLDEVSDWDGRVYAAFDYVDLAAWQTWVDYPFEVSGGRGALKLWLAFADRRLTELSADLGLSDVSVRFAPELPRLELASTTGRFGVGQAKRPVAFLDLGTRAPVAYEAFARDLTATTTQGLALRPAEFTARWEPAGEGRAERGSIDAKSLELAPFAALVEYLPLPAPLRKRLAAMAPEGSLRDVQLAWTGDIEAPVTLAGRGTFERLSVQPVDGAPGFANLSGSFDVRTDGGRMVLDSRAATFMYPGVLPEDAIALDTLGARVAWTRHGADFDVTIEEASVANADLAALVSGTYRSGDHRVDLTARAARADGRYVYRYIPGLKPEVYAWLKRSIQAGTAADVRARIRGRLADFPFREPGSGEFRITAHATGGTVDYHEAWPKLTDLTADLLFDGPDLKIRATKGAIMGAKMAGAEASFKHLYDKGIVTQLTITGKVDAPAAEFLRFVNTSPVRGYLDGALDGWALDGAAKLALRLDLPIEEIEKSKVSGSLQLANATLLTGPGEAPFTQLAGQIDFTEAGATSRGLVAQYLGGPISATVVRRNDGATVVNAQGSADVAAFARAIDSPHLVRLRGMTTYRLTAAAKQGETSLVLESPLTGVAADLPAPFAKPADATWPLRIERITTYSEVAGRNERTRREAYSVTLAKLANAQLLVRYDGERNSVERGAIGIGDVGVALPERPGLVLSVNLPVLDLDRLLPALSPLGDGDQGELTALSLRADRLVTGGREFHDVNVRAQRSNTAWTAQVAARELAGDIVWQPKGAGEVSARLKHLTYPAAAPDAVAGSSEWKELPALFIVADRFVMNEHDVGALEVRAVHEARGWRLQDLALVAPEGTFRASGLWRPRAGGMPYTELAFKFDVNDVGKYLARLGQPDVIARGTAVLEGDLRWNGAITAIDYDSLTGKVSVSAEKGQFVKLKPGIGRLLGVLSLQSIPRRMSLDFRDVFSEGFAFDTIAGSASVATGIARTQDLAMVGPSASVLITGTADLARETQDLRVRVVPSIGDSVAAAAGVALLNPIVGVGALIAQRVLKDPIGQMLAFEYGVTGSWSDPAVERLQAPVLQPAESAAPLPTPATKGAP